MSGTVKRVQAAAGDVSAKYDRSSIKFPYGDLDDAVEVARAINGNYGTTCATDQLAASLGQTISSGSFRVKTATASIFGVTENAGGEVSLTDIGRQIVDPARERTARASAFLAVPLYKAIYDKYRGHSLPPAAALEREMANLGVAAKQVSKARQVFERSADAAGFFSQGKTRLVMPGGVSPPPPPDKDKKDEKLFKDFNSGRRSGSGSGSGYGSGSGSGSGDDGDTPNLHPFVRGLLESMPKPGSAWPVTAQAKWLQTAANIFGLLYETDGNSVLSVTEQKL